MPYRRRVWILPALLAASSALPAQPALAAPDCPGPAPKVRTVLQSQGTLESVIVGGGGRLYFTNEDSLLVLDRRGGEPRVLTPVMAPGGLAFDGNGMLIVGYGNTASNGLMGDQTGPSGLLRVDPTTGTSQVYATGLSMANGLVRSPGGSFFASNDFGSNIDRIRNGVTERGWSQVESGNGLAIDSSGRYLYVAQTFRPAAVQRIDLRDPTKVSEYARDLEGSAAGLDGMTRDAADRLFVAANGAGEVWRVDREPRRVCVLLGGLPPFPDGPSAVAVGSGSTQFPAGNLYVVSFGGQVLELPGVAATDPAGFRERIRLGVRPRTAIAGRLTLFTFHASVVQRSQRRAGATAVRRGVRGARIRLGRKRVRTDRHGRARIAIALRRSGRHRAGVWRRGYRPDRAAIRVRPGESSDR